MNQMSLSWSKETISDPNVQLLLQTLAEEYPISEQGNGLTLSVEVDEASGLSVSSEQGQARVVAGSLSQAARGVGILLADAEASVNVCEKTSFNTRGVMLDCSRGAVMKVSYIKQWLRRLALFGYNMVMLYTQDTYRLPGEDYFGYARGAYTADELKDIDQYASKLGIEMVGCIQVLGHIDEVLRWPAYSPIRDTKSVMLTSEEKTYELIEKMLEFYGSVFASRRIHIGMDETHDLGRGRYMDLNGYRKGFDIYSDHLDRVVKQCTQRGLKPIIWSDMYFRMHSKNADYYDKSIVFPPDTGDRIPDEVQLTFWDYYHEDEEFYVDWIRRHKSLGYLPLMASAIWTWPAFWYDHRKTADSIAPCITACQAEGVDEIVFTMWGDDGAYCDWSSAWAGACYAAERLFNGNVEPDEELMERRFEASCGGCYRDHVIASTMSHVEQPERIVASGVMWDDPLLGIYMREIKHKTPEFRTEVLNRFARIRKELADRPAGKAGNVQHARLVAQLLEAKVQINIDLEAAYADRDENAIKAIVDRIPTVIAMCNDLIASFRRQWYERCKPQGFEIIQVRLAGIAARYNELGLRLRELLEGKVDSIPELDEKIENPKGVVESRHHLLYTAFGG